MEVMLEIYKTLRDLGIEWREKTGDWSGSGAGEQEHEHGRESGDGEGEGSTDAFGKEGVDIFFVETRWRVGDVIVRIPPPLLFSCSCVGGRLTPLNRSGSISNSTA